MSHTVSTLPKVVEMLSLEDTGPESGATCPHCGADGRYIYHFRCEDGNEYGAMSGCVQLFPKSKYAARMEKLLAKEKDNTKTGRTLAGWDVEVQDAIRAFMDGDITESQADARIRNADAKKTAWMKTKGYR